jgi:DNA topoisomerase III
VARQQADQIFNLSLTRTATKMLVAPRAKGVIGIGRVKTPTLAIVCMRELEIRNFRVEDYFEVVATAEVADGSFMMRHAPPPKQRIKDRSRAEAIAKAAANHTGPLGVTVEHRRQAPPRLFDLPSLQKTCGQRWGWTADRTLAVAQELYDGEGKKLITYPRAEARHLAENQIGDVPAMVAALTRLRGFAHLRIDPPVIRRGKSGHFSDKALEGVSHHAIVPNVNVLDDLEQRIARLNDDEKRLLALICRSYLAAVMPDYEYRHTVATMRVPVPGAMLVEFRAVGHIPLKQGWKAVYGATEPEPEKPKEGDAEAEQTLPQLVNGEPATLTRPYVDAKKTQPPPRYNEGTLVDAMQNAWRFVTDDALRERLKEAKGIGTPATRAEIIKGLKRQNMLTADGKLVVPTPAGLQLFELLKGAAPALVDPGTTAVWEMRLDEVVTGRAHFKGVIDEIASEAGKLIDILRRHTGALLDLSQPAPTATRRSRARARTKRNSDAAGTDASGSSRWKAKSPRSRKRRAASPRRRGPARASAAPSSPPTARMVAFAEKLAKEKKVGLPAGYAKDFEICRRFLDDHAGRRGAPK